MRRIPTSMAFAVGLTVCGLIGYAQARSCEDRVAELERELFYTRHQLQGAYQQLRHLQQRPYQPPYQPPYSSPYGGWGTYGQGPLGQTNRTLQELEQLRRNVEWLGQSFMPR
jgi:hypothetical protein